MVRGYAECRAEIPRYKLDRPRSFLALSWVIEVPIGS